MAIGDVGGVVTELVLTCLTPKHGPSVNIVKGDALALVGNYIVTNAAGKGEPVFGQALASTKANGEIIPVKVRGVCIFEYEGFPEPVVNGLAGIACAAYHGKVKSTGYTRGVNLSVDTAHRTVHVLL